MPCPALGALPARLLDAKGAGGDARLLGRAVETMAASLRRQRARGVVAGGREAGDAPLWRLAEPEAR